MENPSWKTHHVSLSSHGKSSSHESKKSVIPIMKSEIPPCFGWCSIRFSYMFWWFFKNPIGDPHSSPSMRSSSWPPRSAACRWPHPSHRRHGPRRASPQCHAEKHLQTGHAARNSGLDCCCQPRFFRLVCPNYSIYQIITNQGFNYIAPLTCYIWVSLKVGPNKSSGLSSFALCKCRFGLVIHTPFPDFQTHPIG